MEIPNFRKSIYITIPAGKNGVGWEHFLRAMRQIQDGTVMLLSGKEKVEASRRMEHTKKDNMKAERGDKEHKEDVVTLFVDNLPLNMSANWLRNIFKWYGGVEEVYISWKPTKKNTRFGLVRMSNVIQAMKAIRGICGVRMEGKEVVVKKAKFGPEEGKGRREIEKGKVVERNKERSCPGNKEEGRNKMEETAGGKKGTIKKWVPREKKKQGEGESKEGGERKREKLKISIELPEEEYRFAKLLAVADFEGKLNPAVLNARWSAEGINTVRAYALGSEKI